MANIRKYDIGMRKIIKEGYADIFEIAQQYVHTSPATDLQIVEILPPYYLITDENGEDIPHELSNINTDPLVLYLPLTIKSKVNSIKVRYYLGYGCALDDDPDNIFKYLEFGEIIKVNFCPVDENKEEKITTELRHYTTVC